MTFTNPKMAYRVTLNTDLNLFIVFDKHDDSKFAFGITIEQAIQGLTNIL